MAGLDAGLAFNDWPLMDGAIVPTSLFVVEPWWLNFFENIKLVQFTHRLGAYVLTLAIIINFLLTLNPGTAPHQKKSAMVMVLIALGQGALGVITLVLQVPLNWALFHQAGAIILLGYTVIYWRTLSNSSGQIRV